MAYLMSEDTAQWIKEQKKYDVSSKKRRGWILGTGGGGTGGVSVCRITGGNPIEGYTAKAFDSMKALRESSAASGRSVRIFPCEIGLDASLPSGTIVLCHETVCAITGGSEDTHQQEEEEEQQGGN